MLVFLSRGPGVGGTLAGLALRGPAVRNWCMGFWRPLARQGPTAPARLARSGCFDIRRERACWARIHRCASVVLFSCFPACRAVPGGSAPCGAPLGPGEAPAGAGGVAPTGAATRPALSVYFLEQVTMCCVARSALGAASLRSCLWRTACAGSRRLRAPCDGRAVVMDSALRCVTDRGKEKHHQVVGQFERLMIRCAA